MSVKPSFPYLKKGEGVTKRYGVVYYPVLNGSNSKKSSSNNRRRTTIMESRDYKLYSANGDVTDQSDLSSSPMGPTKNHVIGGLEKNHVISGLAKNHVTRQQQGALLSPDSGRGTQRTNCCNGNGEATTAAIERDNYVKLLRDRHMLTSVDSSPYSDSIDFTPYKDGQHGKINAEMQSFELLEDLANNASIRSDSSLIHKITHDDVHRLSSVQEDNDENNSHNDNDDNIDNGIGNNDKENDHQRFNVGQQQNVKIDYPKDYADPKIHMENARQGSVKSADSIFNDENHFSLELPPILRQFVSSENLQLLPPFNIRKPFTLLQEHNNVAPPLPPPVKSLPPKKDDIRLKSLERKLRSMLSVLTKDSENLNETRLRLEEKEKTLEENFAKLNQEKLEFNQRMDKELTNLRKEYNDLERERALLSKEQNLAKRKDEEMISLLRKEITELSERLNEKEASLSSSRYQIREMQKQISTANESVKAWQTRHRSLEDQLSKVNKENALLRCQNWKLQSDGSKDSKSAPVKDVRKSQILKTSNFDLSSNKSPSSTDKSHHVRFLLPDDSPVFQRTENRAIQTAEPSDAFTQTSLIGAWNNKTSKSNQNQYRLDVHNDMTSSNSVPSCLGLLDQQTVERTKADGSTETIYPNGTIEAMNKDGSCVYTYSNGDTRKIDSNGIETYHFAASNITQVCDPTGLICIKYGADGREEKHFTDGRVEIFTADQIRRTVMPNATETVQYPDGTVCQRLGDDVEILSFTDGSKETRCQEYTKREFANGDVKFRFKDGSEETRLASGRIRVKDAKGRVVRDEFIKDS